MLLGRIAIALLILFELLNLAGILKFTLDFSWLGLLVTSVRSLIVIEALALSPLPYFLAAIGLWLDALGDVAHLYGRFDWYDQFMHLAGGGIVMAASLSLLKKHGQKYALPLILTIFLALGFVALFGDFYEIEEYLEDRLYHGRQVRLGGGPDTADDLLFNLVGGVAVGLVYLFSKKIWSRRSDSN